MRLVKLHNETKNKDEKMWYLFKLGMCNIGYCNSKNPFGEREQSGGWVSLQVKNYDLQYRMYQMAGQKYYFSPNNLKEQLDKSKPSKHFFGSMIKQAVNHFYADTYDLTNTYKLKGQYTNMNHYQQKVKVKHERLLKGKYYQCDDISNWFRGLVRYTIGDEVRLYFHEDYNYYQEKELVEDELKINKKSIMYEWFKSSYPYDPSYFAPEIDEPVDYY